MNNNMTIKTEQRREFIPERGVLDQSQIAKKTLDMAWKTIQFPDFALYFNKKNQEFELGKKGFFSRIVMWWKGYSRLSHTDTLHKISELALNFFPTLNPAEELPYTSDFYKNIYQVFAKKVQESTSGFFGGLFEDREKIQNDIQRIQSILKPSLHKKTQDSDSESETDSDSDSEIPYDMQSTSSISSFTDDDSSTISSFANHDIPKEDLSPSFTPFEIDLNNKSDLGKLQILYQEITRKANRMHQILKSYEGKLPPDQFLEYQREFDIALSEFNERYFHASQELLSHRDESLSFILKEGDRFEKTVEEIERNLRAEIWEENRRMIDQIVHLRGNIFERAISFRKEIAPYFSPTNLNVFLNEIIPQYLNNCINIENWAVEHPDPVEIRKNYHSLLERFHDLNSQFSAFEKDFNSNLEKRLEKSKKELQTLVNFFDRYSESEQENFLELAQKHGFELRENKTFLDQYPYRLAGMKHDTQSMQNLLKKIEVELEKARKMNAFILSHSSQ